MAEDRFIKLPEVTALTTMCRSKILEAEKTGQFPKSVKLVGKRAVAWSYREVQAWIAERLEARNIGRDAAHEAV